MKAKFGLVLLAVVLLVWVAVTLAALAGMYKLWWDRERVAYFGKTVAEQRLAIAENSGLPAQLFPLADRIAAKWPPSVSYAAEGDHNQLSYLKYLLIPRLPLGSSTYSVSAEGQMRPEGGIDQTSVAPQGRFAGLGVLYSLVSLLGLALLVRALLSSLALSLPECMGGVLLVVMAAVCLVRVAFSSALPAFWGLAIGGGLSWLALGLLALRRSPSAGQGGSVACRGGLEAWSGLSTTGRYWLVLLAAIVTLACLWTAIMAVVVVPDDWDAWAIWAPKAKVLALGQGPLADVSHFGHGDYPLLWPAVWAYAGWLGGGWEEQWSRGWGTVFLVLCLWEMAVIIHRTTGRLDLAWLGAALFVSMPMIPLVASWSYAEAPFWLLTTCCLGCLLHSQRHDNRAGIAIAALLAVGAAYTKNEGVLFSLLAGGWLLLLPGGRRWGNALVFLGLVALCYSPWLIYTKYVLQLGSHATAGLHFDAASIARALSRLDNAVEAILAIWLDVKQWNIVLWLAGLALICSLRRWAGWQWALVPIGMLLCFFIIIIFHEAEIYWQVGTSWNRLTVQVLPFLLVGLVCRFGPEVPAPGMRR